VRKKKRDTMNVAEYRRNVSEHAMQVSVVEYARRFNRGGAMVVAIPNAGKRSPAVARAMQAEGLTPGVADLCFIMGNGITGWLELKTQRGRLSPTQLEFQAACQHLGHLYEVAYTFDDAIAVLKHWGAVS